MFARVTDVATVEAEDGKGHDELAEAEGKVENDKWEGRRSGDGIRGGFFGEMT